MKAEIKAEELMIGNLVLDSTENTTIVESIIPEHNRVRYGIILTEEWLLKFGFDKRINPASAPIWDEDIEYGYDGYRFSQDVYGKWFLLGYTWNTKHFGYVHQLQNLYFCLTGTHLTIKP